MNLSRFYAIGQVEYCRNFIFKRNFPFQGNGQENVSTSWDCIRKFGA
jgi:hypothetical protein